MPDATPPNSPQPPNNDGSGLPPRLLAKLKVEIEGYELIDRLGEGGQATVYKAIQKKDGQTVAVKVLHAGPHATEEARARLKREINALRAINHPNIVQAIAAGRTRSGLDCLVMSFVEGRPLDDLWNDPPFAAQIAPQPADLLRFFKTICETVQAAHRKGITHRDLSPSNILIDASGQPHILDFGMASTAFDGIVNGGRNVTVTGQFIGKLKYASPEQASGARTPGTNGEAASTGVDIRSDVYALGVMLYQLLTGGAFPYEVVGNVIDVLHNIIYSKPRPPSQAAAELRTPTAAMVVRSGGTSVPPVTHPPVASDPIRRNPPLVNDTIEAIVLKALEKNPDQRYQSAGELAADIDRYLAGQPTSAVVWSKRPKPASKSLPFRRAAAIAASLVLVATLVGVTMNAKTLAVWLGLATATALVLPAELTPLAPSTAEAAVLAAQQPEGSERRLNDLAADLARLDARLRAVHRQLAASTPRKPPELEDRQPGASGPFPADEFLAALSKSATDTGRTLGFEPLAKADHDRAEQAESSALERETDQAALLARRAVIDAEQATTWARLSWGTFTGRETDRLFRFRLKTDPTADANMTNKGRVLEAGVKVRRLAARAMDDAATALRVPEGGEGSAGGDLGAVASTLAEQMRAELANFQKVAGAARDSGSLKPEEAAAVAELQKHADRLRDALDGTTEMHGKAKNAEDELGRFTARDRLQRDLRDTTDAASRLDAGLVKLAGEWKFEVDPTAALRDAAPAAVRRPQPPVRHPARQVEGQAAMTLASVMPVDSTWNVRWTTSNQPDRTFDHQASVQSNNGTDAVMRWNNGLNTWLLTFQLADGRLKMVSCEQADGGRPGLFREADISGEVGNFRTTNRAVLSGTIRFRHRFPAEDRMVVTWQFDLRRENPSRGNVPAAAADPALKRGDRLTGQLTIAGKAYAATATVEHISSRSAVVRVDNGVAVWDYSLQIDAERAKVASMSRKSTNSGNQISNWDIDGRLLATGVDLSGHWTLRQPNGTVTRDEVRLTLTKE